MKTVISLLSVVLSFTLINCTSTDISSFRDPGFVNYVKKVLIVYSSDNLNKKNEIESLFCSNLSEEGDIVAVRELDLLPPLKEYSHEERIKILSEANVEAIIIIYPKGESKEVTYYTSSSTSAIAVSGSRGAAAGVKTNTQTTPNIRKYTDNNIELFSLSTNSVVWKASTSTVGKGMIGATMVNSAFCSKVIEDLIEKRIVKAKK